MSPSTCCWGLVFIFRKRRESLDQVRTTSDWRFWRQDARLRSVRGRPYTAITSWLAAGSRSLRWRLPSWRQSQEFKVKHRHRAQFNAMRGWSGLSPFLLSGRLVFWRECFATDNTTGLCRSRQGLGAHPKCLPRASLEPRRLGHGQGGSCGHPAGYRSAQHTVSLDWVSLPTSLETLVFDESLPRLNLPNLHSASAKVWDSGSTSVV